jgi:16S rRNA (guanine527-N7)-methyltransferase
MWLSRATRPTRLAELSDATIERLLDVLEEAKSLGFLGPGPVDSHLEHARRFVVTALELPARALDLGSGGGVPGLVLAFTWPKSHWVLLDAMHKRCVFLRDAVERLGLVGSVEVVEGRAEDVARRPEQRSSFDLVTSRSFGSPAVTAECAAGFLKVGGHLLVSEPPGGEPRWPAGGLGLLGLSLLSASNVAVLQSVRKCPNKYPRKVGQPAKQPLF